MTTDNFCIYLQNSDTSPFSIPCFECHFLALGEQLESFRHNFWTAVFVLNMYWLRSFVATNGLLTWTFHHQTENIRLNWKNFPGTNDLADLASSESKEENKFYNIDTRLSGGQSSRVTMSLPSRSGTDTSRIVRSGRQTSELKVIAASKVSFFVIKASLLFKNNVNVFHAPSRVCTAFLDYITLYGPN